MNLKELQSLYDFSDRTVVVTGGAGVMEGGVEKPNVRVTLASKISEEDCARLNLGYMDPSKVRVDEWKDREGEGVLYVPKASEILYRLKA